MKIEDGREVIERYDIGFTTCEGYGHYCGAKMERDETGEYMPVAQHERIVAAKDAEIARLRKESGK